VSGDYLLAVKSIGLSKVGGRKPCTLASAAKHNKRESPGELECRGRIDGTRVRLNYSIAGAGDSVGVLALAQSLMVAIGIDLEKIRHDYCQAIEVVFSLPQATTIDTQSYFAGCVAWCCTMFDQTNILSADVHLDESAPHCHVLVAPIRGGKWVGSSLIDRPSTHVLRKSFERTVAMHYGLKMSERLTGKQKAQAVAAVTAAIEQHHRELIASPMWQPIRKAIERGPAPFIESLGLVLADKPAPKMKAMAQTFTGTGKGPKRESSAIMAGKPIGIADTSTHAFASSTNPLGIENNVQKHQSLSCVGIAPATTIIDHQKRVATALLTAEHPDVRTRMKIALATQEPAIERQLRRPTVAPESVPDEDGYCRVRDADALPEDWT